MKTLKYRRTPWDNEGSPSFKPLPDRPLEPKNTAGQEQSGGRKDFFFLHGLYVFDPERSTSADFRQFLWAGLRLLSAEAQDRGFSKQEVSQLLVRVFDVVHDAADGLWATLRDIVSKAPEEVSIRSTAAQCGVLDSGAGERARLATEAGKDGNLVVAASAPPESPEQAELRRLSILLEEQAAFNRAFHDEEMRDLLDD
jgi:hypothetical protein